VTHFSSEGEHDHVPPSHFFPILSRPGFIFPRRDLFRFFAPAAITVSFTNASIPLPMFSLSAERSKFGDK